MQSSTTTALPSSNSVTTTPTTTTTTAHYSPAMTLSTQHYQTTPTSGSNITVWQEQAIMATRKCLAGGLAAMTVTSILNPADLIKTRLQTMPTEQYKGRGLLHCARDIVHREGGLFALWKVGLAVSAARSLTYSGLRLGLYDPVKDSLSTIFRKRKNEDAGVFIKVGSGLCTGMLGSAIVNPLDVVKIRVQSVQDSATRNRPNMIRILADILKNEGVVNGLYKGTMVTVIRAGALTGAQLASYDHSKYLLTTHLPQWFSRDNFSTHVACAIISGFVTNYSTSPFDVVKTRYMNDRGKKEFNGVVDCFFKIAKNEGVRGLYRGAFASWLRLGPHFLISLPLYESLRKLFGVGAM